MPRPNPAPDGPAPRGRQTPEAGTTFLVHEGIICCDLSCWSSKNVGGLSLNLRPCHGGEETRMGSAQRKENNQNFLKIQEHIY